MLTASIGHSKTKRGMENFKIQETLKKNDEDKDLDSLKLHIEGQDNQIF